METSFSRRKDMKMLRSLLLLVCLTLPAFLLAAGNVNINTADKETLVTMVKGIGEKKAEAIIAYRQENGPFESIDDLANVKGIGESTIEANRTILSVSKQ